MKAQISPSALRPFLTIDCLDINMIVVADEIVTECLAKNEPNKCEQGNAHERDNYPQSPDTP